MPPVQWIADLGRDLRLAARGLRRAPGWTAAAVLMLALGVGANTAIFSAIYPILLRPLPYPHANRLTAMGVQKPLTVGPISFTVTYSLSRNIWARAWGHGAGRELFQEIAYFHSGDGILTGAGPPRRVSAAQVGGGFFSALGVLPILGRPILPADTRGAGARVAVLGNALWRQDFGASRKVLGRRIMIGGESYAVIGVMPPRFSFASSAGGLWTPLADAANGTGVSVVGRLRPGVTRAQVNARMPALWAPVMRWIPSLQGTRVRAAPMPRNTGGLGRPLWLLLAAAGFVLLIACVNTGGLLLARGQTRRRELAVRRALGAGAGRIRRQLLAESLLLAIIGGGLAAFASYWLIALIRSLAPASTPQLAAMRLDPAVLAFTAAVAILAGFIAGLAPAWRAGGGEGLSSELAASPAAVGDRGLRRAHAGLVGFETALTVILLAAAAVAFGGLHRLMDRPLGFEPQHLLTAKLDLGSSACGGMAGMDGTDARCGDAVKAVLRRIRALPGVQAAAAVDGLPPGMNGAANAIQFDGQPLRSAAIYRRDVSPGYLRAMGIRLLAGRGFNAADTAGSPPVALVNDLFAREFPHHQALGQGFRAKGPVFGKLSPRRIVVGEFAASRETARFIRRQPEFLIPLDQSSYPSTPGLLIRAAGDPAALAPEIRRRIAAEAPSAPVRFQTMSRRLAADAAQPRFQNGLLAGFALLALALAWVGIYGLVSYAARRRAPEMGLRMALGAEPGQIRRLMLRQGLAPAAAGIALGIPGAVLVITVLRGIFFGLPGAQVALFAGVAAAVALIAFTACDVPARRAGRMAPAPALREE